MFHIYVISGVEYPDYYYGIWLLRCRNQVSCYRFIFFSQEKGPPWRSDQWTFLLFKFNDGASYKSDVLELDIPLRVPDRRREIRRLWLDLIAAVLARWVSSILIR